MLNFRDYKERYFKEYKALEHWKNLKNKNYPMNEILLCIYNAANGSIKEMNNLIARLTNKKNPQGRSQTAHDVILPIMDIIRGANGELELRGKDAYNPLRKKGQHVANPARTTKSGQGRKDVEKAAERLGDLGEEVRKIYPDADNHTITMIMQAIRKFGEQHHINALKVAARLQRGSYDIDFDNWRVVPVMRENKERKTIVINESDISKVIMTPHKFHTQIRRFIGQLLQDPVNAQPSELFKFNGYTRSKLINHLLKRSIIQRKQRISDKDENGQPKKATMMVKFMIPEFMCPKKDFDRKLEKLFIELFEKNLPPRKHKEQDSNIIINEEGDGGAVAGATNAESSGQILTALGEPIRRQMPSGLDETTAIPTVSGGNYNNFGYDVPAPVKSNDPTLKRGTGKRKSNSVYPAPRKNHHKV